MRLHLRPLERGLVHGPVEVFVDEVPVLAPRFVGVVLPGVDCRAKRERLLGLHYLCVKRMISKMCSGLHDRIVLPGAYRPAEREGLLFCYAGKLWNFYTKLRSGLHNCLHSEAPVLKKKKKSTARQYQ